MVQNRPIDGGLGPIQETSARARAGAQPTGGAAFKALLERLGQQARDLQQESSSVDSTEALAGAVDRARESLEDALSFGMELLEAYRAAQQNTDDSGQTS